MSDVFSVTLEALESEISNNNADAARYALIDLRQDVSINIGVCTDGYLFDCRRRWVDGVHTDDSVPLRAALPGVADVLWQRIVVAGEKLARHWRESGWWNHFYYHHWSHVPGPNPYERRSAWQRFTVDQPQRITGGAFSLSVETALRRTLRDVANAASTALPCREYLCCGDSLSLWSENDQLPYRLFITGDGGAICRCYAPGARCWYDHPLEFSDDTAHLAEMARDIANFWRTGPEWMQSLFYRADEN